MKIANDQLGRVAPLRQEQVDRAEAKGAKDKSRSASGTDKVALSIPAGQMENLKKVMKNLPEVRQEKVERIKTDIAAGTYSVDGKAVAEKMLAEWRDYHVG